MLPAWAIQLLQMLIGVVLDEVIKDLPQIRSALVGSSTPAATDAPAATALADPLDRELNAAINEHEVPAP